MSEERPPTKRWRLNCTKALARETKTSVSLWERMRCEGRGPAYVRIGRKVMYDLDVVQAWMEANGRAA